MEMEVTVSVHSYMLARSLYRSIVEDHEFYYKDTVSHAILNDADNSEILWKTFCKKVNGWVLARQDPTPQLFAGIIVTEFIGFTYINGCI